MAEYTKEQLWKLYEKLPEELKGAIFSEETADTIGDICQRNDVEDKKISEVAKYTGRVLLGILLPAELQNILEKEAGLKKEAARRVSQEINRFVFYPLKESLSSLYKIEITPSSKPPETPSEEPSEVVQPESKEEIGKPDVYREPIE